LILPTFVANAAGENDDEIAANSENTRWKFAPNNPDVMFFAKSEDDDTQNHFKLRFERLTEAGGTGAGGQVVSLASLTWSHTEPEEDENGRYSFAFNATQGSLIIGIGIYIFAQETEVQNGNESVTVLDTELKFDITISGWEFQNSDNQLMLELSFIANKHQAHERDGNTTKLEGDDGATAYLNVPDTVVADGENADYVFNQEYSGNMMNIDLTFPSFTDTLYYDPTLGLSEGDSSFLPLSLDAVIASTMLIAMIGLIKRRR